MRLFLLLMFLGCGISYATNSYSQVTLLSLNVKNKTVKEVFSEIEKNSEYLFFYYDEIVDLEREVSINLRNQKIGAILDKLFENTSNKYVISDRQITISRNSEPIPVPPPVNIRGIVKDENGSPLDFASVGNKNRNAATLTDERGVFSINASEGDVLVISYIGYSNVEYKITSAIITSFKSSPETGVPFTVILKRANTELDQVQVIAYGTTTRRLSTGSVSTVKEDVIAKQPVSNPLLALAGQVPGLFIQQNSGLPGAGVTVQVQGQSSLGSGNAPLYVIDGVPYPSAALPTTLTNQYNGVVSSPFSYINSSDIKSIEVLKDADATAIYGSRAANGAIIITTKKGSVGPTKVDLNVRHGWGRITRMMDMMNTQQYLEMRMEAKRNDNVAISPSDYDINGAWDTTRYTNWQKELIGNTAQFTDVTFNVSGGNTNTQFLIGGTHHRETTVFPGDLSDKKTSLHFNINNVSANGRFHIQLTGSYMVDHNRLLSGDFTNRVFLAPNAPPLYNDDGTLNWAPTASGASTWSNPLAILEQTYLNKTNNLISNAIISYNLLPGLDIRSSFNYANLQTDEMLLAPLSSYRPDYQQLLTRSAQYTNNNINSWAIEPQLSYKKVIGKGMLDVLLGATAEQNNRNGQNLLGSGYNSDQVLADIRSASSISTLSTIASVYKYTALFGRVNYKLHDKYIVNLTARRDGSSRFGPKNRFHNFGAVGAAWIFSQEKRIKNALPFVSFGKLRGSYGTTGNDQIGDYSFLSLYTPYSVAVPYEGITALTTNSLTNPYLQWEETRKLQVGIDIGMFNDEILLTTNYVHNRSSNQLIGTPLPSITGLYSITENSPATIQNTAWEFVINTQNIRSKDFNWSSGLNLTVPRNKLVAFPDLDNSTYARTYVLGQPVSITRAYHFLGVNPTTGVYEFTDSDGNPTASPNPSTDKTVIINTLPKFYGGFSNTFSYKGFQLDVFFQFVKQMGPNTIFGTQYTPGYVGNNEPVSVLARWQNPGDVTTIQRYNSNQSLSNGFSYATQSDAHWSDASYIRLKNLSLSYQLVEKWVKKVHMRTCSIYLQGQNLLTITNYQGMDPESQSISSLPPLRVLALGLQIGF